MKEVKSLSGLSTGASASRSLSESTALAPNFPTPRLKKAKIEPTIENADNELKKVKIEPTIENADTETEVDFLASISLYESRFMKNSYHLRFLVC